MHTRAWSVGTWAALVLLTALVALSVVVTVRDPHFINILCTACGAVVVGMAFHSEVIRGRYGRPRKL